ncbi:hypothetical protein CRENBAI_019191 [Crenichthys baileyi]|uniref:Pyrin domain-containing protein n=1 Tax=Crenichthys baileyi TaxID=28760 RepID=A0AAV9RF03_9TELE
MDQSEEKRKRFLLFKDKKSKRKVPSLKKPSFKLSAEPVPGQASSNRRSTCLTWCWPARISGTSNFLLNKINEYFKESEPLEEGSVRSSAPRPDPVDSKCVPEHKSAVKAIPLVSKEQEEIWSSMCPPGDKDTETKLWLKKSLQDLGDKELRYFHRYLQTADKSKDGFKPIKKIRLEGADRLDTVDLMLQMYPKKTRAEVHQWLLDTLDNLDDRELKYFHWFLQSADESKDKFKPIKKKDLEDADRLKTADLMIQIYTTNSKAVTKMVLNKIKSNKGKVIPEAEEQMKPSSPAAAEEKERSKVLDQFVKKVPKKLAQNSHRLL